MSAAAKFLQEIYKKFSVISYCCIVTYDKSYFEFLSSFS